MLFAELNGTRSKITGELFNCFLRFHQLIQHKYIQFIDFFLSKLYNKHVNFYILGGLANAHSSS